MSENEISIKVTGDTDDASSKLKGLEGDVQTFAASINKAAEETQKINPAAFKEIATDLNAGKISMTEFAKALEDIRIAASGASAAAEEVGEQGKKAAAGTAAVGEAAHLSAGGMRELIVVAREVATGNLTRLPGSLSILATRLGGIPPQAILAAAAIAGVGYAIYEAIESSEKFESELATIQNSLTAIGSGNTFDRGQITAYIDEIRQIPGIDRDAAASIEDDFSRSRNIGGEMMRELIADIVPFSELIGKKVPEAAKDMAAAFNDPVKGLQLLKNAGVEVSAATQEQVTQMMAVNDLAGAQRALLDGISNAMSLMVDSNTGLTKFWNDLRLSLSGVNEEAAKTRDSLLAAAAAAEQAGNASQAELLRYNASMYQSRTRNLPDSSWGGSSGAIRAGDDKQGARDKEAQTKKDNDAVAATNKLFDTGNSLLAEQEKHKHNIQVIQDGINAAVRLDDDAALKRGYADLETENKKFYGEPKKDKSGDKLAMAEAKAAAEGDDAEIKSQRAKVDEQLRLGEVSSQEAVKQLLKLAAREHEINVRRIEDMRAVYAKQGDKAGVATSDGDLRKENARYSTDSSKINDQGAEAAKKAQEAEIEGDRRVADEKVRTAQVANQEKVALGQMSAQQEIQAEIEAANQKHVIDDQYYASLMAHEAQDSAAYKKTLADKLVAEEKFNQTVLQLRTKLDQQSQKADSQLTKSITNGLNQTVNGVLTGTQTMAQAFERMGQNIVLSVVEGALDKIVTKFLTNNSTIQAAQTALDAFLGVSDETNSATSIAATQAEVKANITAYAGEGAAAAIASTSAIPIVGPALAPEVGAGIFGDIMSYNLASAAGGMIVDGDQIARVHDNEMVLPARYTSGLTSMIDQANAGGGAGMTNHFHVNVNANGRLNAGDLDGLHDAVVGSLKKAARNGQFGGMRST